MRTRLRFNSSHRAGLIALALAAVLLPVTLLSVVQYRSLAELESKTRVAVQEGLRQTLLGVSRRAEERLEALAAEAMAGIDAAEVEREDLPQIERRLASVRESHPEINLAFVIDHSSCTPRDFAVFASPGGVRRIEHGQFRTSQEAQTVVESFHHAGLLRSSTYAAHAGRGALFEQSSCSVFPGVGDAGAEVFVFIPLRQPAGNGQLGFAGVTLKSDYLRERLLPQVIGELLRESGSSSPPIVRVIDENRREVYASRPGLTRPEVAMSFSPVFRRWELGIGYEGTSVAALAEGNFRKNLVVTASAFLLLLLGLTLTLRATARGMRLAEAKSTFVSNVSHELKTPLALIRLFAEMLETGMVRDREKAQEYGRVINHESRRLTQLIDNILDFSRIEAGRREYRLAEADAAAVVKEVLRSYEYQLKGAGFEVKGDYQPNLPPVLIDRDAVAQAVLNLLDNAIRYSPGEKQVEVRVGARGDGVAIELADRGIGIPPAEQGRIFEKFYRVSTGLVHNTKGSGLGLAIVKHIVEAHRGRVLVESAPGRGSRFTILLPAARAATDAAEARGPSPGAGGLSVAENPHR